MSNPEHGMTREYLFIQLVITSDTLLLVGEYKPELGYTNTLIAYIALECNSQLTLLFMFRISQ